MGGRGKWAGKEMHGINGVKHCWNVWRISRGLCNTQLYRIKVVIHGEGGMGGRGWEGREDRQNSLTCVRS